MRAAFPLGPVSAAPMVRPAPPVKEPGSRALHRNGDSPGDHLLHDALLKLCKERGWNQQKFAQASGLAVPTAAKLLKGDLPGRGPTHIKLREILGLDQAAYAALLPPSPENADEPPAVHRVVAIEEDPDITKLARAIHDLNGDQRAAVWNLVKAFRNK